MARTTFHGRRVSSDRRSVHVCRVVEGRSDVVYYALLNSAGRPHIKHHLAAGLGLMPRIGIAASAFVLLTAASAHAAPFAVNTTADTTVAGGCTTDPTCSLRDAVSAANAAVGADTISIPSGTYSLTSSQLTSTDDIALAGAGARSTVIVGAPDSRVLFAENTAAPADPVGPSATISDLTITGGSGVSDGGGIFAEGPLNLLRTIVRGNTSTLRGAGIATPNGIGDFDPNDPPGPTNVPGDLPVSITESTISGNTVEGTAEAIAGGLATSGDLAITNSTISGNVARSGGTNQAGALQSANGTTTLINSTIAGNTAEGAGAFGGGLTDTPLAAELDVRNTIISGNRAGTAVQNCALTDPAPVSNANITDDTSCNLAGGGTRENVDPLLRELADNGGPTDTRSFAVGAPPQDTGTNTGCPSTDQRGVGRPAGAGCDVGAVELAPPTAFTGSATDVVTTRTLSRLLQATPSSAATLRGSAGNPFILPGTTRFELGTTTAYGTTVDAGSIAAGAAGAPRAARAGGLRPDTLYHFRVLAQNLDGSAVGADATFRTPKVATTPGRPKAGARPRVSIGGVLGGRGCTRQAFSARVKVRRATGVKLRFVRVRIDGKLVKRTKQSSFRVRVPAATLGRGRHHISVRATDTRGRTRVVRRAFNRCGPRARAQPRFTG